MTKLYPKVSYVLDRAADLIEPEGAWCQGTYLRENEDGRESRCIAGAVSEAMRGDCQAGLRFAGFRWLGDAIAWNDTPARTQAEAVAKLREAAAKAREQGL